VYRGDTVSIDAMSDRLALTLGSHAEQTGWRRNQDLIDALPYVDDVTPEQKKEIQGMIEEEVRVMMIDGRHDVEGPNNTIRFVSCRELLIRLRPRYSYDDALLFCLQMRSMNKTMGEYESELPTVSDFRIASAEDTALLESEIERVSSAARRPGSDVDGLDLERYSLPQPSDRDKDDVESWEKAVENVMAQLEHQQTRILNLQLLLKHGPDTWRAYNEGLSSLLNRLDHELQVIRGDCNHINRERKMEQLAAGKEIADASALYVTLVEKNKILTAEINRLEEKINS